MCDELLPITESLGYHMWFHHARFFLGWAKARSGDRLGFETMELSMQRFRRANELVEQSCLYCLMAERYLEVGDAPRALDNVEHGLNLAQRLGERFYEVPLLRLKASCLAAGDGDQSGIDELMARANALATEQGVA